MLDNMKMSAEHFVLGLKHGVYVFVSDSCEYCTAYADSLKFVENCHLHIVECITDADKQAVYQITGKGSLPVTAAFIDNEMQWAALGQLYTQDEGDDPIDDTTWTINKVVKYLQDTYGDKPLTNEEIVEKLARIKKHCVLAYYVFPPNTSAEIKQKQFNLAFEHNEVPIDVDSINMLSLSEKDKETMLKSNLMLIKLVIFDIEKTEKYSDLANCLIVDYVSDRKTAPFEMRSL